MGQKGPPNPHDSQTAWRGFIHRTSAVNRWGRELQQKQMLEGYSVSELGQICGRHSNVVPNSNKAVCLHRFLSGGIFLRWRKAGIDFTCHHTYVVLQNSAALSVHPLLQLRIC